MTSECILEEDLEHTLPGMKLTHLLRVVAADNLLAMIIILQTVNRVGGKVVALSSVLRGDAMEHKLRVSNLKAADARSLCDNIAGLQQVTFARVEHHLHRATALTTLQN